MARSRRRRRKDPAVEKSKQPLWTLDTGITYSGLSLWLECREQFALQYIEGKTPKKLNEALEFGSIFHKALEHQFEHDTPVACINTICRNWKRRRLKHLNPAERKALERLLGLARVLFPIYCKYWGKEDATLKWVSRESKFAIPYTVKDPPKDKTFQLRGMRDGVFKKGKDYGLFETKTKSIIRPDDIVDQLRYDMQTLLYCLTIQHDYGVPPKKILYNVIRRPGLKQGVAPLESYLQRVRDDVESRPDHYFLRFDVTLKKDDLERFCKRTLDPVLLNLDAWWSEVRHTPFSRGAARLHYVNSNALIGKYGKAQMYDLLVLGKDSPYYNRSSVFPELEEE